MSSAAGDWPSLPLATWRETQTMLHRSMQIAGKICLALTPLTNHFWNVALHVTPRGLTTPPMPYQGRLFEIAFDLVDHQIIVRTSDGWVRSLALLPRPLADLYRDLMALLGSLGIHVAISDHPVEILDEAIPFHIDRLHADYDPAAASRFLRVLEASAVVFEEFRARFIGKSSPVHFFWGSFDLALSRFSGRRAPLPSNADPIFRESYSHEVLSAGFWPGDARFAEPAYYAYAVPRPNGFADGVVRPSSAFFHDELGEFLLPYRVVERSSAPRELLLEFLQSTYELGADLAGWDRAALERQPPAPASPTPLPSQPEASP